MPRRIKTDKALSLCLTVTFVAGFILQAVYLWGGRQAPWLALALWAPTLGVFAMRAPGFVVFSNLRRFDLSWVCLGMFLGVLPRVLTQILYFVLGWGQWNERLAFSAGGSTIEKIQGSHLLLGDDPQSIPFFALNLLLSLVLSGMITTFATTLGEEIGWRGFVQPNLNHKYGWIASSVLAGLLMALWYLPLNLAGYYGSEHTVGIALLAFPVLSVFLAFLLNGLRLKAGAIWPCAFLHGFYNASGHVHLLKPTSGWAAILIETGSMVIVGGLAGWLLVRGVRARERVPA